MRSGCCQGSDPLRSLYSWTSDAGEDWGQEEKETTEDEMVGWHHWLNGYEFDQAPGDGEGQGSLMCCSPWGHSQTRLSDSTTTTATTNDNKSLDLCWVLVTPTCPPALPLPHSPLFCLGILRPTCHPFWSPGAAGTALTVCHRDGNPWSLQSPPDHQSTACSQAQLGERCWAQLPCPELGWTPPCTQFALQSPAVGSRRVAFDVKRPLLHSVCSPILLPRPLPGFLLGCVPNQPPRAWTPWSRAGVCLGTPETVTPPWAPEAVSTRFLLTPNHLELSFSEHKEFCFSYIILIPKL